MPVKTPVFGRKNGSRFLSKILFFRGFLIVALLNQGVQLKDSLF